jgi:hypothetical protein
MGVIFHDVRERDQRDDQYRGCDKPRDLRAAADRIVDGGSRVGAGDWETSEQTAGDIRGAKADQLAIGIDAISIFRAEAAGRHDAAAETDDEDRERIDRQIVELDALRQRHSQLRQARGDFAEPRDADRLQIKQPREEDADRDGEERTRQTRRPCPQQPHEQKYAKAQAECRHMNICDLAGKLHERA